MMAQCRRALLPCTAAVAVSLSGCGSSSPSPHPDSATLPDGGAGTGVGSAKDAGPPVDAPVSAVDSGSSGSSDALVAIDLLGLSVGVDGAQAGDGGVTLAQVSALLQTRCVGCHGGTGAAASRLDLSDHPDAATSLYDRLLGPLLLEAFCGEADGGVGTDAGPHHAIVPGDLADSFLYLKVLGEQPSPGNPPPAKCGVRMPRVALPTADGGTPTSVGCDQADGGAEANCLPAAEVEIIQQWIMQGAPSP